jgi:hypothetical protein
MTNQFAPKTFLHSRLALFDHPAHAGGGFFHLMRLREQLRELRRLEAMPPALLGHLGLTPQSLAALRERVLSRSRRVTTPSAMAQQPAAPAGSQGAQ